MCNSRVKTDTAHLSGRIVHVSPEDYAKLLQESQERQVKELAVVAEKFGGVVQVLGMADVPKPVHEPSDRIEERVRREREAYKGVTYKGALAELVHKRPAIPKDARPGLRAVGPYADRLAETGRPRKVSQVVERPRAPMSPGVRFEVMLELLNELVADICGQPALPFPSGVVVGNPELFFCSLIEGAHMVARFATDLAVDESELRSAEGRARAKERWRDLFTAQVIVLRARTGLLPGHRPDVGMTMTSDPGLLCVMLTVPLAPVVDPR